MNPEGYALSITDRGILLAGADAAGIFHGAQTLAQLLKPCEGLSTLPGVRVRDWPSLPMRGAHVYIPPHRDLDFFHRFLDYLAELKFNTLILEIGGGMELKRHPEINRAWRKFSREALNYDWNRKPDPCPASRKSDKHYGRPGLKWSDRGPVALQVSRYFWKDSIHPEVGGGGWLTQAELREIAGQCAQRHIEIIPEVQSLSHAYWLCCAHPEVAERRDDPWPDAYCPSNPRTYELLFDVLDEVIELFKPRRLHIGHDELLSLRVCPKCRKKTGAELFAGDVRRIRDYLAARGIRTMMWPDKLIKYNRFSGVGRTEKDPGSGKWWILPPTHKAIDLVPRDVLLTDWYWGVAPWAQGEFERRGFDICYGNFSPRGFKDWEKRSRSAHVLGATVSSWCEASPYELGHNHVFHDLFAAADMTWRGEKMKPEDLNPLMSRRVPLVIDRLTAEPRWLTGGKGKAQPLDLPGASIPLAESLPDDVRCGPELPAGSGKAGFRVLTRPDGVLNSGIVLGKSNPKAAAVPVGRKARRLAVLHATTMKGVFFGATHSYRAPADILKYVVKYADGGQSEFQAYFGDDIGPLAGAWPQRAGLCYRAVPVAAGPAHTLYAQEWLNPRPNAAVVSVTAVLGKDAAENGVILVAAMNTVE